MKISVFFIFFLYLCVFLYDEVDGYDSRHRHHYKKKGTHHRSNRKGRHHSTKQKLSFPSGTSYMITSPSSGGSHSRCPGRPTYIKLSSKSRRWKKEYELVKKELEKTKGDVGDFKGFKNIKIEKVFNSCLWRKYKYRKDQVYNEAKKVNERMLWHASSAPFTSSKKGLDERYTTLEKGEFGAGLYFSDNPFKTHKATKLRSDGTRVMMLCRVSLGNTDVVKGSVKRAHPPVGFQSVSSSDGTTTEFSIYRGEQAYPDYVITYKS